MTLAMKRAQASLTEAEALIDTGHFDPAFAWAVRGAEVYFRDFLLVPVLMHSGLTESAATKRASEAARKGWNAVFSELTKVVGDVDPMLMYDDSDAWAYWKKDINGLRDAIVHGREGAGARRRHADEVIAFTRQLMTQLSLRMIVSGRHPLADVFRAAIEEGRRLLAAETDDGPAPV